MVKETDGDGKEVAFAIQRVAAGNFDLSSYSPEAQALISASLAPETLRAYGYHWRVFERWCRARGLAPIPVAPKTLADYVGSRARHGVPAEESEVDLKQDAATRAHGHVYVPRRIYAKRWSPSMLNQAMAAITLVQEANGQPSPRDHFPVRMALRGVARLGSRGQKKTAISSENLRGSFVELGTDLRGLRDRALLLVGFAAALRRGELVVLEVGDVKWDPEGLGFTLDLKRHFSGAVIVPGTKTNLGGKRVELVNVSRGDHEETCPVHALRAWLEAGGITDGRIFRAVRGSKVGRPLTPQTVALVVKQAAARLGLDPDDFGGHSLRSGLATTAHENQKTLPAIAAQGRWKRYDTLLGYIQTVAKFDETNASKGIGL